MNPLFTMLALPLALGSQMGSPVGTPGSAFSASCVSGIFQADQIEIQGDADQGSCTINLNPQNPEGLRYRSFLWDQTGIFMVFNSYGEGPDNTTTGARDFYLFPRKGVPSFREAQKGVLEVRAASGAVFRLDTQTQELTGLEGGALTVDRALSPDNAGGVEIAGFQGLLLDCGFAMGAQPETRLNATSVFRDPENHRCEVKNSEIFSLSGGNPVIRYGTDAQLAAFLHVRCPDLHVVDLENP
jgi:hypothetical protein